MTDEEIYWSAMALDEVSLEVDLIAFKKHPWPKVEAIYKRVLKEVDQLKVSGGYDAKQSEAREWVKQNLSLNIFDRIKPHPDLDRIDVAVSNFRGGVRSPDADQRKRFQSFKDVTGVGDMLPRDALPLIEPLERAKRNGGRPPVYPPWRNFQIEMDAIRKLVSHECSPEAAARQVAASNNPARSHDLAKLYRDKMRLRE